MKNPRTPKGPSKRGRRPVSQSRKASSFENAVLAKMDEMGNYDNISKSGRIALVKEMNVSSIIPYLDSRQKIISCYQNNAASTIGARMTYTVSVVQHLLALRSMAAVCRRFDLKESWLNKLIVSNDVGRSDPRRERMLHGLAQCARTSVEWIMTGEGEPPGDLKPWYTAATT